MFFDSKGVDPDFRGKYKINIPKIKASFVSETTFQESQKQLEDLKHQSEQGNQRKIKLDEDWEAKYG